jgi:hypothetical protein
MSLPPFSTSLPQRNSVLEIVRRVSALLLKWIVVSLILFGYPLYLGGQALWEEHWLNADGQQTIGIVTRDHNQHNTIDYRYAVGLKEYTGTGKRNWEDYKFRNVHARVGDQVVVYFSASHPWISTLNMTASGAIWVVLIGPLLILVVWLFIIIKDKKAARRALDKPIRAT